MILAAVLVVVFFVMNRTIPTPSFWLLAPLGMLLFWMPFRSPVND